MKRVADLIQKSKRFLITTHAFPDGDGLGSEMALYYYLKRTGKKVTVLNTHPTPAKFHLVDPNGVIQVYDEATPIPEVDVILIVDTHDWKMLGALEKPLHALSEKAVFIDHHIAETTENTASHRLIDEGHASTGELVYTLLSEMKAKLDLPMAIGIYVAILTDTASFRFQRTSPRSHLIAAKLLELGVLPEQVYQHIYARDSFAKIRLLGHVLEKIQTTENGRIAYLTVTQAMRQHYGATIEDTEAFVNELTLIAGVEIGILFREEEDGRVKVSLRGNHGIPVFAIAKKFGGGGHRFAAGIRIAEPLNQVTKNIVEESRLTLLQAKGR